MSESIRVSGKTVNDAILNAAIELNTTSDNIEYTVIEHESRGFLGIGAKDAVIEASVRREGEKPQSPEASASEARQSEKDAVERAEEKSVPKAEQSEQISGTAGGENEAQMTGMASKPDSLGQDESTGAAAASKAVSMPENEESYESRRERRNSDIKVLDDPSEAIERAETFLKNVFSSMGMTVNLSSSYDGECLNVSMEGDEMGLLIGKRGQTLDSLQYLTSLVVNKGKPYYVRVKLDTENYRERRKATLENLAKNIAMKVKKTRQPVYLEPMNPYERRIIHSALQGDPFVTTHSEGEEPDRKVVVTLKKDADLELLDRKYGDRGHRGGYRNGHGYGRGSKSGYSRGGRSPRYSDREDMKEE